MKILESVTRSVMSFWVTRFCNSILYLVNSEPHWCFNINTERKRGCSTIYSRIFSDDHSENNIGFYCQFCEIILRCLAGSICIGKLYWGYVISLLKWISTFFSPLWVLYRPVHFKEVIFITPCSFSQVPITGQIMWWYEPI